MFAHPHCPCTRAASKGSAGCWRGTRARSTRPSCSSGRRGPPGAGRRSGPLGTRPRDPRRPGGRRCRRGRGPAVRGEEFGPAGRLQRAGPSDLPGRDHPGSRHAGRGRRGRDPGRLPGRDAGGAGGLPGLRMPPLRLMRGPRRPRGSADVPRAADADDGRAGAIFRGDLRDRPPGRPGVRRDAGLPVGGRGRRGPGPLAQGLVGDVQPDPPVRVGRPPARGRRSSARRSRWP